MKYFIGFLLTALLLLTNVYEGIALTVAVFGGSGYVGRRICSTLVHNGHDVISISKSGQPPSYYCDEGDWVRKVDWRKHCIVPDPIQNQEGVDDLGLKLPHIDAAISCIGNVDPAQEWDKLTFFGLAYDDELLYKENGLINECAIKIAKRFGAERFVFLSVSYEVAKMLEGPIDGYMKGKRHAEHVSSQIFGNDDTIVIGSSLIYGGKRFPTFGKIYSQITRLPVIKAYMNGMDSLRNLSSSPMEDWVERALLSPPVKVETIARVASASALGMVTKDLVGSRRQNFFDSNGKPVTYDDVVFVDGTLSIESMDKLLQSEEYAIEVRDSTRNLVQLQDTNEEPIWEGALIGKKPYLYPLPVIALFLSVFVLVSSQQVVSVTVT